MRARSSDMTGRSHVPWNALRIGQILFLFSLAQEIESFALALPSRYAVPLTARQQIRPDTDFNIIYSY